MKIAIQNQSTLVTDAEVATMCAAVEVQANRDFAPAWGKVPGISVVAVTSGAAWPEGCDATGVVIDSNSSEPDALGWHEEDGDKPDLFVTAGPVLRNGGCVLFDAANPTAPSVASVLSHEVLELLADPDINDWVDGPAIQEGRCYALEVADPVESTSYPVNAGDVPVSVSDFVLPAWFDPENTTGPWSLKGAAPGPFKLAPGGYFVVRSAPGTEQQVMGDERPEWRTAMKVANPASRTRRRTSP